MNLSDVPRPPKIPVHHFVLAGIVYTILGGLGDGIFYVGLCATIFLALFHYAISFSIVDRFWGWRHFFYNTRTETVSTAPSIAYHTEPHLIAFWLHEAFTYEVQEPDVGNCRRTRGYVIRFERDRKRFPWTCRVTAAEASAFLRWTEQIPWAQVRSRVGRDAFIGETNQRQLGFVVERVYEEFDYASPL